MTLPTEIDQEIPCPECRHLLRERFEDGEELWCVNGSCSLEHVAIHPKIVAALRNQLPLGHTAVPDELLHELRERIMCDRVTTPDNRVVGSQKMIREQCDAILAHLPAKKPDHVAEIRRMIEFLWQRLPSQDYAPPTRDRILREIAALEAAIKEMEKP